MSIFDVFYPDSYERSLYSLPEGYWDSLKEKGIRAVIFDIDNTLVPHGAPADLRSEKLFSLLRERGLDTMILSNNNEGRVKPFAEKVKTRYICKAGKPSRKGYLKACELLKLTPSQAIFAGDQIFTDILGAKRAGLKSLLVEPIDRSTDIFKIKLKRIPERAIVASFKRRLKKRLKKEVF